MDLSDSLAELKGRIERQGSSAGTEEASKTAFVLPFLQALGYDIFNPSEVVPELTADHGVKKGEKVDYGIKQDEKVVMLVECKPMGANLEAKHAGQLFRYFSVTEARFALLTDGVRYVFYTDLEKENRMDERSFFEFNVLDYRSRDVEELKKFAKHQFDLQTILDTATNLKYHKALLAEIDREFESPSEEMVRLLSSRVYERRFTAQVKSQFEVLVGRALKDFVREQINDRLKSALDGGSSPASASERSNGGVQSEDSPKEDGIETTPEEIEAFQIVRAIGSDAVDPSRIVIRDAKSYCAVLLDDNNRRPVCRFYFGKRRMSVLFFTAGGEVKVDIDSVVDLYGYRNAVTSAVLQYDSPDSPTPYRSPTRSDPAENPWRE